MRQFFATQWGRELEFLFGTGSDVGFRRDRGFSGSTSRGALFYTLGGLDQVREPGLHGARLKIIAAGGVSAAGATTPGDDDFEAGPMQAWFTQLVKATQGMKQGATPAGPRKPPVPPKPNITPSAKKKLKFTPQVSSAELAQELPFSEEAGIEPWDTPSERVD